jgi:SWI/SNF-related matrix-associated actin-dependent regulator of chromatin subfamily A member 5
LTRNSFQPSQGADGESEYDNDAMEEDELMSEAEGNQVYTFCSVAWLDLYFIQAPSSSKTKNQVSAEERKQKKQKRKVAEGQLQVKRQAMDKAKVQWSYSPD